MTLTEIAVLWPGQPEGTIAANSGGYAYWWDRNNGFLYSASAGGTKTKVCLFVLSDLTDDTWEFVPPPLWARKFGRIS